MSSERFNQQPRPEKKKKTLGEAADESRMARISFKRYLRELEEVDEEEEAVEDDVKVLPDSEEEVAELFRQFSEANPDLILEADSMPGGDDEAAVFLLDEILIWLEKEEFNRSLAKEWIDGPYGDMLYNIILESFY